MNVNLEQTRMTCDHCGELGKGVILSSIFADSVTDSIQLCEEHAVFFANEILKLKDIKATEPPSHGVTEAEAFGNDCPNGQCS